MRQLTNRDIAIASGWMAFGVFLIAAYVLIANDDPVAYWTLVACAVVQLSVAIWLMQQ
jgi:hypothetical protein